MAPVTAKDIEKPDVWPFQDPRTPAPTLTFVGAADDDQGRVTVSDEVTEIVSVKVNAPWRVVHKGVVQLVERQVVIPTKTPRNTVEIS